jgi:hypothetical protein
MKNSNILVIVVLAFVAFLFMRNSQASTTITTGKTVGLNNATGAAIQSIVGGLVNIFGKSTSPYSGGDISD